LKYLFFISADFIILPLSVQLRLYLIYLLAEKIGNIGKKLSSLKKAPCPSYLATLVNPEFKSGLSNPCPLATR
jgi:hypothetical protein